MSIVNPEDIVAKNKLISMANTAFEDASTELAKENADLEEALNLYYKLWSKDSIHSFRKMFRGVVKLTPEESNKLMTLVGERASTLLQEAIRNDASIGAYAAWNSIDEHGHIIAKGIKVVDSPDEPYLRLSE